MPRQSNDPIKSAARRARTRRRVGVGASCKQCGEQRPEALVARSRPKCCMRCFAQRNGNSGLEDHHLAGKANSPLTIRMNANDHRTLSDAQYDWPPGTQTNPDGSPLITLAASLRGIADFIAELVRRFLHQLADLAEGTDTWLREQHGRWWEGSPSDGWQPG